MKRLGILWVISTLALLLLPALFDRIYIDDWKVAAIAAVVVGLVNCTIGPVVKFMALPIRFLTAGLFTLVINAVLLLLVSKVVPGFVIYGFWTAFWGAIVYSVVTWVGGMIFTPGDD